MNAWSIKQLKEKLEQDLSQCTNTLERSICQAIGGKEIREKAQEWAKTRKLTPIEMAIAQSYGYKEGIYENL